MKHHCDVFLASFLVGFANRKTPRKKKCFHENSFTKAKELLWNEIDWDRVQSKIEDIQKRIYKASLSGNKGRINSLQDFLISSLDAKLLAVRRVTTEKKNKNMAEMEGRLYLTPHEKMKLARNITIDGSQSSIPRGCISKLEKTEKCPLRITIIRDKAKQKLVLMALNPEWEAKFEPNSYGGRPGRSEQDAVVSILNKLRNDSGIRVSNKYILAGHLKGWFDNIDHNYLISKLEASPKISKQVRAWLKAGIFDTIETPPIKSASSLENQKGNAEGEIIYPLLANVALHGMETFLKKWIILENGVDNNKKTKLTKTEKGNSIGITTYVDDFVIIHENFDIISKAKDALNDWLSKTSKLELNETETKIVDSRKGFTFLGFRFINVVRNGVTRVKIYPSKKNQKLLIQTIGDRCRKFRSISTYSLIEFVKPIILGWGYYFRYSECKEVFKKMDYMMFNIIRRWVFRRDKRSGRRLVKENYFPSGKVYIFENRPHQDNWVLCGKMEDKAFSMKENWLPKLSWISSRSYVKAQSNRSVYDGDDVY